MSFQWPIRDTIKQEFFSFALTVQIAATPLNQGSQQASIQSRIDAIIISVPKAAANVVYLGGKGVAAASLNGLEIPQGVPIMLSITNERQQYEVQAPLVDGLCQAPWNIPFIAWDVADIYLAAVAPTVVGVMLFPAAYV